MKSKLLIALLALCSACSTTSSPTASHRPPLSPDRESADPLNASIPDSTSTATAE